MKINKYTILWFTVIITLLCTILMFLYVYHLPIIGDFFDKYTMNRNVVAIYLSAFLCVCLGSGLVSSIILVKRINKRWQKWVLTIYIILISTYLIYIIILIIGGLLLSGHDYQ